jgi:VanZ family protein
MTIPKPIRVAMLLCCATGVLVLALMPRSMAPEAHGWDKVEHVFAFAVLGVLAVWALPWRAWRLVLLLIAFGILIEILQGVLPVGRDADPFDVLADAVGVALGMAAEFRILRRTRRE